MLYQNTVRGKGTVNPTSTGAFRILGLGPKGTDLPCKGDKPPVNRSKGFQELPTLLPRSRRSWLANGVISKPKGCPLRISLQGIRGFLQDFKILKLFKYLSLFIYIIKLYFMIRSLAFFYIAYLSIYLLRTI